MILNTEVEIFSEYFSELILNIYEIEVMNSMMYSNIYSFILSKLIVIILVFILTCRIDHLKVSREYYYNTLYSVKLEEEHARSLKVLLDGSSRRCVSPATGSGNLLFLVFTRILPASRGIY